MKLGLLFCQLTKKIKIYFGKLLNLEGQEHEQILLYPMNVNPQQNLVDEFLQQHQLNADRRRQVIGRSCICGLCVGFCITGFLWHLEHNYSASNNRNTLLTFFGVGFGLSFFCSLSTFACYLCRDPINVGFEDNVVPISMFDNDIIDMIDSNNLDNLQNNGHLINENEPMMP